MALFWDNTNGRLGVGTNTPNYQLDIVGSASYTSNLYTPLSQGSIPFIGSSGLISQNNSSLFWNSTYNRLGIGTSSPEYDLDVNGYSKFNSVRINNVGVDTLAIYGGNGVKQLYIDNTNQLAFNTSAGQIYFGTFNNPSYGRAGFSVPNNVVFVVDAVTARTGFGGGVNLIFNSPDALVDIQGKANELQLSVKASGGQSADILEVKNGSSTKTVFVDSSGALNSTLLNIPITENTSPVSGSMYFNARTNTLYIYNGTNWANIQLN